MVKETKKSTVRKGRPLFYDTPEKMEQKIDEYFAVACRDEIVKDEEGRVVVDTKGRPVIKFHPPTVSGLAVYLGFFNRQGLYDYVKREDFSGTIKKAISRIEDYAEKQLTVGNSTGAIFWLKNHGWKDKSLIEARQAEDESSFKTFYEQICEKKDYVK